MASVRSRRPRSRCVDVNQSHSQVLKAQPRLRGCVFRTWWKHGVGAKQAWQASSAAPLLPLPRKGGCCSITITVFPLQLKPSIAAWQPQQAAAPSLPSSPFSL